MKHIVVLSGAGMSAESGISTFRDAGLLGYARPGTPVYLIDPNDVNIHRKNIHFIKKGASEGVAELKKLLSSK